MMRHLITLRRIFAAGIKNFFRNSWLSIAATAVMVVALVIVLMAVVLNVVTRSAIAELSTNLKVSVYLQDNTDEALRKELQNEFFTNSNVDKVTFISKEEAQKQFAASFQEDKKLLEGLALIGGNTLPASFEVGVTDLSKLEDVGNTAKQEKYASIVESVSLGKTDVKKTIDRAANAQNFITSASVIAASIFAVVSMLIIFNTIRMAIFTRSEEIRTQKLLGATPGYIRGPFLVESSMYGVIAGIVASSIVLAAIYSLGNKVSGQAEFIESYDFLTKPSTIFAMYAASMLLGILVGIFSSTLAMGRYLKLKHW
ncbi:MAG: permease-like cell division protein FtsX [Candidatus Saccharimonadales bacterium]